MKTRSRIAATITGGAAAVALFAATPSIAASGPTGAPQPTPATSANQQQNAPQQNTPPRNTQPQNTRPVGDCDGTGTPQGRNGQGRNGQGNGQGAGMQRQGAGMGAGMGTGMGTGLTTAPSGTLTDAQKQSLAAMAEEEKLAQDLYIAFGVDYGAPFSRITNAETRHLAAVRTLLTRYDIKDPTSGKAAGTFATSKTQNTYNTLLALGNSEDGARNAARTVESTDITDLKAAAKGVTAPDVKQVYANLLAASQRHLVAFGG